MALEHRENRGNRARFRHSLNSGSRRGAILAVQKKRLGEREVKERRAQTGNLRTKRTQRCDEIGVAARRLNLAQSQQPVGLA